MSDTEIKQEQEQSPSMGQSILRSAWGLGLFAILTAGLIALTQVGTKDKIEKQIKQARSKALLEITPLSAFNNDLLDDAFELSDVEELGIRDPAEAYVAKQDGIPTRLILPVTAPDGYSGPISMIMSISMDGEIGGVRVIKHKETPGLGDKIETKKSDWIFAFEGLSLENTPEESWRVKKDGGKFDQLTGATITPRAVVNAIAKALLYFRDNRESLLSLTASSTAPGNELTGQE